MKHTPGPWCAVPYWPKDEPVDEPGEWRICQPDRFGRLAVLTVEQNIREPWKTQERESQAANARLIAAAPELLDALQLAARVLRDRDLDEYLAGEYQIIEDAIAKATA